MSWLSIFTSSINPSDRGNAATIAVLRQRLQAQEQIIQAQQEEMEQFKVIVESLQSMVKEQQAQIERLRRDGKRQAAPFSRGPQTPNPKKPGRKKGEGTFSYRTAPEPSEIQETLSAPLCGCPECGSELKDIHSHEQIEMDTPVMGPLTRRFVTQSGYCPHCRKRVRSRHPEQTSTATGAAGVHLGPNVRALAADMKHRLGVPYAKIAEFFATAWDLPVTKSALCHSDRRLAQAAKPIYDELLLALRECAAVFADETGWRIGLLSAWLWTFTSERITIYTIDPSRSHQVVVRILGKEFKGVLHSDCFLAYDHHLLEEWLKQKCLGHIQKDLSLMQQQKTGGALRFPRAVAAVLRKAFELRDEKPTLSAKEVTERLSAIERELDSLIDERRQFTDPDNRRMAKRLVKQRRHLFTFLTTERSEATNNRAERALRPAVISRKTGACNKTPDGAQTHAVLASIGVTAKQQGHNPVQFLYDLILNPAKLPELTTAPLRSSP
jgi:transposase